MKTLKLLLNHEWSEETKRKRIKPKESEEVKEQKKPGSRPEERGRGGIQRRRSQKGSHNYIPSGTAI
jgi:hypothetical protein